MDLSYSSKRSIKFTFFCIFLFFFVAPLVSANSIFKVYHKFAAHNRSSIDTLKAFHAHDRARHGRLLAVIDVHLGGRGSPNGEGLYYAQISVGTPPKDFLVQVDTGSDIFWINCKECDNCPKESKTLGKELTFFDPKESSTVKEISCGDDFCEETYQGDFSCPSDNRCTYRVVYGDGSASDGYYLKDALIYNQVTANGKTTAANANVIFGCSSKQSGDLGGKSNTALDGIIGFGQSNSSVIAQLAAAGKVKEVFSHCLDNANGGGIFAIGRIAQPKIKTTPMVPNMPHYNVNLMAIKVGQTTLDLPSDLFEAGEGKGTIIDSGSTLAYLPDVVYETVLHSILTAQPKLEIKVVDTQYQCFPYEGSVDDAFPTITFHFEDSLTLVVHPHDYLFTTTIEKVGEVQCIGWMNSALQSKGAKDMVLLGDLVLSNLLVQYDIENQTIGWTEHNCSSSITLLDDKTGAAYPVESHDVSSAWSLDIGSLLTLLLLSAMLHKLIL